MTATTAAQNRLTSPGHPQRWVILGVICLAQLTVLLDNTVLNVAIPSLTRELDASTADVQWMINAYSLVQSGLLLTAGSSADRYGRKKMLLAGLALFGVGSLVAGLAQSSGQLIAARAGHGHRRCTADDHDPRRRRADLRRRRARRRRSASGPPSTRSVSPSGR